MPGPRPRPAHLAALAAGLLGAALGPAAAIAGPGNDDRNDATKIKRLPDTIDGTVDGAGTQDNEPASACGGDAGSVWYRIDPGVSRRVVARLRAGGDLDASIDVFERLRSDQAFLTCDRSDVHGSAAVAFRAIKGHSYLIRVARRPGSASSGFSLNLQGLGGGPKIPGPPLPPAGISASLDRVQRTANAWSLPMRAGVRYRIALSHPGSACIGGSLLAPGAGESSQPVASLGCDGYALYTPPRSGRYSVLVRAASNARGRQRYRLQANRATANDSAPGTPLANYAHVRDSLNAFGTDRIDLYRFDITRRSVLFVRLGASSKRHFDVKLITADGRELRCGCGGGTQRFHKGLKRGRFFLAVQAHPGSDGAYSLMRASRTITHSHLSVGTPTVAPGTPGQFTVNVSPTIDGPVSVLLEQYDPLSGWQYAKTLHGRAVNGVATLSAPETSVGRWRASASYDGTKGRAPSDTGFAPFAVEGPLHG